jgi:hypothetical protein
MLLVALKLKEFKVGIGSYHDIHNYDMYDEKHYQKYQPMQHI